jgi:hypothetical protein
VTGQIALRFGSGTFDVNTFDASATAVGNNIGDWNFLGRMDVTAFQDSIQTLRFSGYKTGGGGTLRLRSGDLCRADLYFSP